MRNTAFRILLGRVKKVTDLKEQIGQIDRKLMMRGHPDPVARVKILKEEIL